MTLRNFDTDLDRQRLGIEDSITVTETATVRRVGSETCTHLSATPETWDDRQLRDYVLNAIEQRFGPQVTDPKKISAIFKSFLSRYGDDAAKIARYAFEVRDGYWRGAPVSVTRFCRASDAYFGDVILAQLNGASV